MKFLTTITIEEEITDEYDLKKLYDLYMMFPEDEEEVYNVLAKGVIETLKEKLVREPTDIVTCTVKRIK